MKLKLKTVYQQNVQLDAHVRSVESQKREKESEFDRVTLSKRSVLNNRTGKLEAIDLSKKGGISAKILEDIPEYEKASFKEKEGPLDSLVMKFER